MTNSITIEQAEAMTTEEWEKYRLEKWNDKKSEYSKPVPGYFMANRDSYINWIKKQQDRGNKKIKIDVPGLEKMNEEEWNSFRNTRWQKKGEMYLSGDVPAWFMEKESYIKRLKNK
ncbi:MAG: hypothetical protein LBV22_03250 [Mycoplasmataceae bacterium]|jgi:hypothetical protein|nr:hypothetical protein [Mycoplasmataceae bacterium]